MTKYAGEIASARASIAAAGTAMELVTSAPAVYDPNLGDVISDEARTEFAGLFVSRSSSGWRYVPETLIGKLSEVILAEGKIRPVLGDRVQVGTTSYEILWTRSIAPDGAPIIWFLGVE